MAESVPEYVEDASQVVHSIMLWRIYDVLLLLLTEQNPDVARKIAGMHEKGQFLGPNPSYTESTDGGE